MPSKNKLFKSSRSLRNSAETSSTLIPIEDAPRLRQPYSLQHVHTAHQGRVYTPAGDLVQPVDPGRNRHTVVHQEDTFYPLADDPDYAPQSRDEDQARIGKKQRQWARWNEEVIPRLLPPFVSLLHTSKSLRNLSMVRFSGGCSGCNAGTLNISCIYFDKIEDLTLCMCSDIACQLLVRGLFPCAPCRPSLAVDLNMLDFTSELFVNAAPNTTAWCETLENFLGARQYKLTTRDSLRGRYTSALQWYTTLVNKKNLVVSDYINGFRSDVSNHFDNNMTLCLELDESSDIDEQMQVDNAESEAESEVPLRPSDYLRERCPLCFGGKDWFQPGEECDVIVCLDACFTQKRRKSGTKGWTPPHQHPETVFVSPEDIDAMEDLVSTLRPTKAAHKKDRRRATANVVSQDEPGDNYERGLKVPTSVLDECGDSFKAADENRIKASTNFFSDTGLMALLCRHDRVLWLANMTSAGEKQHYALTLLEKLFHHIPSEMRVGVLYDIGCQLHHSCTKFGFLGPYTDRITFGISVFHAYGHQWPCQIIYHPRKCVGFGLTDGEGCERFWSSIKLLIPSLRVSGYYTRLYALDTQVKHMDKKSLLGLGNWLRRKWISMQERLESSSLALQELESQGVTRETLRKEWNAQVKEQTKPSARQSKNLANKVLEEILLLKSKLQLLKDECKEFQEMIETGIYKDGMDLQEAELNLEELEANLHSCQKAISNKRATLSIDGRLNLDKLMGNKFLQLRMNALALKQRIRDRLRQRRFELDSLKKANQKSTNYQKLQVHSTKQLKRKEPNIQALAHKYNKLCTELQKMLQKGQGPRGALAPHLLNMDGLFHLDVDDEIWQDIGLGDEQDDSNFIPLWLGDEQVRQGIKEMLQYDRSIEEQKRLINERCAMQDWMIEEWACVQLAMQKSDTPPDVLYQLSLQEMYLARLCVTWQNFVGDIPVKKNMPDSWGPSPKRLDAARQVEVQKSTIVAQSEMDEWIEDEEDEAEEDGEETELFDSIETAGLW